jgi:hypothetical protein
MRITSPDQRLNAQRRRRRCGGSTGAAFAGAQPISRVTCSTVMTRQSAMIQQTPFGMKSATATAGLVITGEHGNRIERPPAA